MGHTVIEPRTAIREDRRQANEALGRSFCKTLTELITNSDSSAKRKHRLPNSSGLLDLMLRVPVGGQLDTAALKAQLQGKHEKRTITIDVVTARRHGRQPREIVVVDQAEGISKDALQTALEDIGGDRIKLAKGVASRSLFGRGLSDVLRAHQSAEIHTCDGHQLSVAKGEWRPRWTINLDWVDSPQPRHFADKLLAVGATGTAVRFVASNSNFHIPDPAYIVSRLANFYMLRLIAADPNVELVLNQYRTKDEPPERITYDFPVGEVVESFTRTFDPGTGDPLKVEFLLVRSERKLEGPAADRDARENGLLIVDDLDAVYDLTFVEPDYERAEFLRPIFGIVRVHGLRAVLEAHLNDPDSPTSPLRVDRDGFNRDHEFSRTLLDFLASELRPCYERERKRQEEREHGKLSTETRKRIDDALKQLNKYFQQITEMVGPGQGGEGHTPEAPKEPVSFFPQSTRLTFGRPRKVLLLIRDTVVADGCELVATADEGFVVQPAADTIYKKTSPRWPPHQNYFAIPFTVTASTLGQRGAVRSLVECADGQTVEAVLRIDDVLDEPTIVPPATMEFRPNPAMGRPNRRNTLALYVNPAAISEGHYVRFRITRRTGAVELVDDAGTGVDQIDVKLSVALHGVRGQNVFRVRVPWRGTAWNQNASVQARVKVGAEPIFVHGQIRLDEPDPNEGGFFQRVEYDELDDSAPSKFAAGVITVNILDPLNAIVFGTGSTKEASRKEFDRRLSRDPKAQQRLASLLLEEMSFRMVQQLFDDNKLSFPSRREITAIHDEIDKHKFRLAAELYRALVR